MKNWKIWLSPPQLGGMELSQLQQTLQENWITTTGPQVLQFEELVAKYINITYTQATNSGTSAIHLALLALGVGKGDFVICPAFTFAATAFPILYVGARPVFIDSEESSWNMSPQLLQTALADLSGKGIKPAAIMLVHIYGNPANIKAIKSIAQHYEIPIIEDAAQSLGSKYNEVMTGKFGTVGIYSFNGNKIITTGGGGMLVTDSEEIIQKSRIWANQANTGSHFFLHHDLGYNYRLSNILASIGLAQMQLLQDKIAKKRNNFERYKTNLCTDIDFQTELPGTYSNRWLTALLFPTQKIRDKVFEKLTENGIESRFLMNPLFQQPVFSTYPGFQNGVSLDLYSRGLCIPSGTALTEQESDQIIDLINKEF